MIQKYIWFSLRHFRIFTGSLLFSFILISGIQAQDLNNITKQKPFTISGNLAANGLFYGVSGIEARSKPLSYLFSGNATIGFYGVQIPLSFVFSEQERNFRQPFNQFGLSPKWKWITLHIGYRSLNYSSFTLSGHNMLGLGVDLNPGNFRFSFMFGRFQRAVSGSSSGTANSTPAYKRRGFATKIGYGTNKRFFDLIFLRVSDDSTSLSKDTASLRKDKSLTNLTPAANMVIGYNTHIEIIPKLIFESEAAFSVYTNDRTVKDTSDLNDGLLKACGKLSQVNSSSRKNTAIRASLMYKEKFYSIMLQYKRISPNYQSMGAYYMSNDMQQISIEPSVLLLKNKLNIRASAGLQNDNLNKAKNATTYRLATALNISYNPFQFFGIDASYSNYFTSQKAGSQALLDSTKYYQVNENILVSPRFIVVNSKATHIISLIYNFMRLNDMNTYTENISDYYTHNVSGNYILTLLQYNASVAVGINYTTMKMSTFTNNLIGGSIGLSKTFLKNKLSVNVPLSLQRNTFNSAAGWIMNAGSTISYRPFKRHSFNFNFNYIGNLTATPVSPVFHEIKGVVGYVFTF